MLLVEPAATLGVYLEELLGEDYDIRRAASAAEALRIVARTRVEAVLVDVGGAGGEALLAAIQVPELRRRARRRPRGRPRAGAAARP